MNRREALATLISLPELKRISVANLKAEDVIVIESDAIMSLEQAKSIKASLSPIWPGRKIVILSDGLKMKVVSG